jgi:hypothetical protein
MIRYHSLTAKPVAQSPIPNPSTFFSVERNTRIDDQNTDGYLTTFCEKLSGEVYLHTGQPFHIFQDIKDIAWGQP